MPVSILNRSHAQAFWVFEALLRRFFAPAFAADGAACRAQLAALAALFQVRRIPAAR